MSCWEGKKMPDFKPIRSSVWHGNVAHLRESRDHEACHACDCLPASEGGTSCSTSECVNRGCQMECVPSVCPCAEECMNQDIQRGIVPNVECATITVLPCMHTALLVLRRAVSCL